MAHDTLPYRSARDLVSAWLKKVPMTMNKWGPFFEDVGDWSDTEINADTMAMYLASQGHEVVTANDGLEAVETAATFQPAAVLLDIGLPKLNGYDAATRIRAQRGSDVMLIALTGWGQETDRRRSREAGFDHHLTKPVELDELGRLLSTAPVPASRR